jgi:energy-coupling factor transporter ATP-binding protein EcfA2
MLTRLRIRNFKKFKDVDIELGQAVVLIGPNNSGKTAALQALALWDIGRRRWTEKRGEKPPGKRPGATINRNDLLAIPVPVAKLLWRNLHVQDVRRVGETRKQETNPVFMDIIVEGITDGNQWRCGLEFYYANQESFYCRPLRMGDGKPPQRSTVPTEAAEVRVAFLPPMSGLAEREFIKQQGEIGVLIGQGQTAQVLRNLCYQIYARAKGIGLPDSEIQVRDRPRTGRNDVPVVQDDWDALVGHIKRLFGVELLKPVYTGERSEITMSYREKNGVELDLSCAGRGLQQTLLLLAHLYANPRTVLLLDEPDAHLEILRQRQTYELLTETARLQGSQVVVASHSEIVLEEAADRDIVVAFVGAHPHRINDRGTQLQKALREIGFDQYYLAQEKGWVLYLEGSTDLSILRSLADILDHPARKLFEQPFVHYVGNKATRARDHFFGLAEAHHDLVGAALFDRSDFELQRHPRLKELMWARKELENYLCREDVLLAFARGSADSDLFSAAEAEHREQVMRECIAEMADALRKLKKPGPWSPDIKASDEFLDPLFDTYFEKLGMPNQMRKTNYHVLARFVRKEDMDPEVVEKLDAIVKVAMLAKPAAE